MCRGVPTMSAYWERYSVKVRQVFLPEYLGSLYLGEFFSLGSFFGLKVIFKPRTNRGSVQKGSIICVFWNAMARNCLLDEICLVCVSLKFLFAEAAAISASFRRCFLSLYKVSWIPLIEVVTVLVNFVVFPWLVWVVYIVIVKLKMSTVPNWYMGRHSI